MTFDIVLYNSLYGLEQFIRSADFLFCNTDFKKYNVNLIVILHSSNVENIDICQYLLSKLGNNAKYIVQTYGNNLNYAEVLQSAIQHRETDYKIIMDSKALVTPGWLEPLIEAAQQNTEAAFIFPESKTLKPGFCLFNQWQLSKNSNSVHESSHLNRNCFLVKTAYIKKYGFFDTAPELIHFEEIDLYFRYLTQGLKALEVKNSYVFDYGFSYRNEKRLPQYFLKRYRDVYKAIGKKTSDAVYSEPRIDVVFLSPDASITGGGQKVIHNICNSLNESYIPSTVVCHKIGNIDLTVERLYSPINIEDFYRINIKPKIIVFSLNTDAIKAIEIADQIFKKNGYLPRIVQLVQDVEGWFHGHNMNSFILNSSIAQHRIFVSPFLQTYLQPKLKKPVCEELITNSISLDFIPCQKLERVFDFCVMMRYDQKRGSSVAEEAIRLLDLKLKRKVSIVIFGGYKINKSKYNHIHIVNLPKISEAQVSDILNKSQWFVENSFYQGFGMTALEAFFAGCSLISTNNAGACSVLPNDSTLFYPVGDSKALADLMLQVVEGKIEGNKKISKENIYLFSSRMNKEKYKNFFETILEFPEDSEFYSNAFNVVSAEYKSLKDKYNEEINNVKRSLFEKILIYIHIFLKKRSRPSNQ